MTFRSRVGGDRLLFAMLHGCAFLLCYWAAFQLRFDGAVPEHMQRVFLGTAPVILLVKVITFALLDGLVRRYFITFSDLVGLARAAAVSMLLIIAGDYFLLTELQVPRSVIATDAGFTILLIGAVRSAGRFVQEYVEPTLRSPASKRALLIGIDSGGERVAQQLRGQPSLNYAVVGFLSDDPRFRDQRASGLPCLGTTAELVHVARRHAVNHLLVLSNAIAGHQLRELVQQCRIHQIDLKMIPAISDMLGGNFQMRIRDVDIHDLLNRPPVEFRSREVGEMLSGRSVLVTGAGGSIGSEICRQVARCRPKLLVLVERAENSLFRIEQELLASALPLTLAACMADITDEVRMKAVFDRYAPDIVFHAAAHKHVPLMERNPGQAIANNVLGTKTVADLSRQFEVERFVFISTDKSVNPASVMGATKHLAERYVHSLAQADGLTAFMIVRFGNVMGSDGSVIGIFQQQIRQGGPLKVTHPDMERFFMTIPEASQLVLQAAALGQGGETYVLDMGQPIKIVDLARDLIRLSGHTLDEIGIQFVGLRPGEKLTERLYTDDERLLETAHPRIWACYRPFPAGETAEMIARARACIHQSPEDVRAVLAELIPEYAAAAGDCDELQRIGAHAMEEETFA